MKSNEDLLLDALKEYGDFDNVYEKFNKEQLDVIESAMNKVPPNFVRYYAVRCGSCEYKLNKQIK